MIPFGGNMPNILIQRLLKNIVISIVMLSAGIIFGIASHSVYVACVPLLFGLLAAVASIKMYCDWKTDRIIIISAVCIHKQPYLLGKTTYIFNIIGLSADKDMTFTLQNVKNNSFSVAATYDFLFDNRKNLLSEQTLIDYTISDTHIEQKEL